MLQIAMLIGGIVVLCTGKLPVGGGKSVRGGAARLLGFLMMLPLPVAFAMGFALGTWAVQNNRMDDVQTYALAIDLGVTLFFALLVGILAACMAKPNTQYQQPGNYPSYGPPQPPQTYVGPANNPYAPPSSNPQPPTNPFRD